MAFPFWLIRLDSSPNPLAGGIPKISHPGNVSIAVSTEVCLLLFSSRQLW